MSPHTAGTLLLPLLLLGAPRGVAQERSEPGAWEPGTESAAEAAAARLGARRAVEIRARVVAIPGLTTGTAADTRRIVGSVQGLRVAMRELGAAETELEIRVRLPADVLFDFDRADIRPDAARALSHLATLIRAHPNASVRIEGHTDSKGEDQYNVRLSQRRAESVRRWLGEREGIAAGNLLTDGVGESRAVASNETEAGRQANRRVEVVIRKAP